MSALHREPFPSTLREATHEYAGLVPTPTGMTVACRKCQQLLSAEQWMERCRALPSGGGSEVLGESQREEEQR